MASVGGTASGAVEASPSRSLAPEDAQLRFARCMRENGVDIPDPGSGDGSAMRLGKGGDQGRLQGALRKCQSWLQAGGKMPDLKDPRVHDQYVRFAQCMREHGVDVKDPGPDGTLRIPSKGIDMERARKARDACRSVLPGASK
ncbi:hypothetical protein [Actinomadura roseirufa]|uniref:hypothetical protein n=1 Tax=Actinomadura roseirufa TaxID=2094049 RepID=UPI0010418B44|nr:hypothetical protein [Actinomadura roseirufa]